MREKKVQRSTKVIIFHDGKKEPINKRGRLGVIYFQKLIINRFIGSIN